MPDRVGGIESLSRSHRDRTAAAREFRPIQKGPEELRCEPFANARPSDNESIGYLTSDGRRALFLRHFETSEFRWSLWASDESPRQLAHGPGNAELTEDGRWVVEHSINDSVRLFRTSDGALVREIPIPKGTGIAILRRWVRGGTFAMLSYPLPPRTGDTADPVPMTIRFLDIETGNVRGEWTMPVPWTGIGSRPNVKDKWFVIPPEPCYSADGKKMGLSHVTQDGSVRAWVLDMETGRQVAEYTAPATPTSRLLPTDALNPFSGQRTPGAFGTGERFAVWAGRDLVIWSGPRAAPVRLGGHTLGVASAFSSDGRRVFTLDGLMVIDRERTVRVWDADSGRELVTERIVGEDTSGAYGTLLDEMWLEGDRLHLGTMNGVRVFDGTP